jgi:hypothetical protein
MDCDLNSLRARWKAEVVVAGLVAHKNMERFGRGRCCGLEVKGELGRGEVDGRVEVEGGVMHGLRLAAANAEEVGGVAFSEADLRGDGTAVRLLHGVKVPPGFHCACDSDFKFVARLD